MSSQQQCPHKKTASCTHCSKVKMLAYLHNDDSIVWFSFFKDDKRYGRLEMISGEMGSRLQKKHGENIKKMMFFDNHTPGKPIIGEN
ncbi:hypothetical protein JM79_3204 [Gramella sp. Hel_I_59]|uniref:hypothetical protein n=1 Tax=Gramella sp. Hel_I_59 TaxID=1249978 RepID=UPI0011544E26|nr:hypothetical protein [Gramella sp. Hel_I_59]TQI72247.1 hypothetical protein JM79_3204 [Gramella sp. Hel_I_59]